jgi:ubiquinone/menaquinone biosynthesis C-methylase UbiE
VPLAEVILVPRTGYFDVAEGHLVRRIGNGSTEPFPTVGEGRAMAASSTFISASGEGYELLMGRWSRRLAEPFLDFCGWQDGESILDAGCGTGSLTFALAQRTKTANIEGIDFSSAYIEYATKYNHDPRIRFRVGDICALPYENAAFDRVMSLLVLHFVPRPEDAVAEMRRVARPGATVAAAVWDARGGFVANRIFFDTAATLDQKGSDRRARNYTRPMTRPGELASAWRTAGFIDIREAMLTIRMEFESFNDYWAPYVGKDGAGAEYVATLESAQQERLRDLVHAAYLDGEADGPRSYAAIAWTVAGRVPG